MNKSTTEKRKEARQAPNTVLVATIPSLNPFTNLQFLWNVVGGCSSASAARG